MNLGDWLYTLTPRDSTSSRIELFSRSIAATQNLGTVAGFINLDFRDQILIVDHLSVYGFPDDGGTTRVEGVEILPQLEGIQYGRLTKAFPDNLPVSRGAGAVFQGSLIIPEKASIQCVAHFSGAAPLNTLAGYIVGRLIPRGNFGRIVVT